ncbi:hypothetical protein EUGRSUZ_H02990 [Eucalyptus grandis]|uniref:Uncharacterized protein n=2 Tax=Eucalyptus grandis TaxID=71139 RepID=A0ACC3JTJ8_EUCGR|nr:hypothetical protein EUGRSUZ_H02990 [Eucalyptus grandis]
MAQTQARGPSPPSPRATRHAPPHPLHPTRPLLHRNLLSPSPPPPALSSSAASLRRASLHRARAYLRRPQKERGSLRSGARFPPAAAPLFPGRDHRHWLVVMIKPGGDGATKQRMIDCHVETLARVAGRLYAKRKQIRRSTMSALRDALFLGVRSSRRWSNKLGGLPWMLFVIPESYVNPEYKDCGGCIKAGAYRLAETMGVNIGSKAAQLHYIYRDRCVHLHKHCDMLPFE